jgi:hypothetical protein
MIEYIFIEGNQAQQHCEFTQLAQIKNAHEYSFVKLKLVDLVLKRDFRITKFHLLLTVVDNVES